MKVSVKRAFCTAMSAMLTLAGAAGLASCGDGGESDPNTLIIDAFEGGYGVDWLYAIADKFEEKNEGVSVRIYPTEDDSMFGTSLLSGRLTSDIVFERYPYWAVSYTHLTLPTNREV